MAARVLRYDARAAAMVTRSGTESSYAPLAVVTQTGGKGDARCHRRVPVRRRLRSHPHRGDRAPGSWAFEGLPGLRQKAFTLDEHNRRATNVYLWDTEEAARGFFSDELVERVTVSTGCVPPSRSSRSLNSSTTSSSNPTAQNGLTDTSQNPSGPTSIIAPAMISLSVFASVRIVHLSVGRRVVRAGRPGLPRSTDSDGPATR